MPWGQPDALEQLLADPDSGIEPVHQFMSLRQLAYDFFESDELRTLFMRAATTSTGCFPDDVPGLQGLVHNLPLVLSFEPAAIAVGGSQAISDALVVGGRKRGAEYFTVAGGRRASRVDGRPRDRDRPGRRHDGRRRRRGQRPGRSADRAAAALDASRSTTRLRHRIRNIHYDRGQLFWANLALHEPPAYSAAAANPGVGPQPRLYWGPKDPDYIATRYQPEVYLHGLRRAAVRAQLGRHALGPLARAGGQAPRRRRGVRRAAAALQPEEWTAIKTRFSEPPARRSGSATRRT